MEKVASNNSNVSSNSVIMDLTKSISQKLGSSQSIKFKDFVKSNTNDSEKYEPKREIKKNTNSEKENSVVDDKSTRQAVVKKNNLNKKEDVSTRENTKDFDEGEASNISTDKTQSIQVKPEKIQDKNIVQEVENQDVEEVSVEITNLQSLMYNLINIKDVNQVVEKLQEVNPETINKIMVELDENRDLIPQELKTQIENIVKAISSGNFSKAKEIIDSPNFDFKSNMESVIDNKKISIKNEKNPKEKTNENIDIKQTEVSSLNLNKELVNLKQKPDFAQNNNQQENFDETFEFSNEQNNLNFVGDVTSLKSFAIGNRLLQSVNHTAMQRGENIQNFAKIVDEIRMAFRDDKGVLNIKLEPESLGKLSIKINSENGIFNVSFYVESDRAKQALENDMQVLRNSLMEQGVNIQDINVQVGQNNEELNYHQNIMQAINFSKKGGSNLEVEELNFEEVINPYTVNDDIFNDLI